MSELKITYDSEGNKYIKYKYAFYSCDKSIDDMAYNGKCIVKKTVDKRKMNLKSNAFIHLFAKKIGCIRFICPKLG